MNAVFTECDGKDGKVIDIQFDQRVFDNDPIWDEIEKVDGIISCYKAKDVKKMLKLLRQMIPDEDCDELLALLDKGSYRMQVLASKAFDYEKVCEYLREFFASWSNGKERLQ